MNTLTATKRGKTEKLKDVRTNGMIPAVVYGAHVENTPISVPFIEFNKVFKIAGESSAIVLDLEKKKIDALIYDVQYDPIKGQVIHADFLAIDMNKPIIVSVPIEFVGVSSAEKSNLGTLVKVLHELEIEALPKNLPHSIEVDITALDAVDTKIHVKDIILSVGVTMKTSPEEVVALIAEQKEIVEEAAAPVDLSAIEVEKKGKKEEEGAESAETKE